MQLSIGGVIQTLRKKQGLTQEQLAQAVGVSAPAVSKWESAASYPDITLLMPLARALGTTVDGLLQFEAALTDDAVMDLCRGCAAIFEAEGIDAGLQRCHKTINQYPNSLFLKFRMAALLQSYLSLALDEQQALDLTRQGVAWMKDVLAIDRPDIRQAAVYALSSQYFLLADYENAQAMLDQLPTLQTDPRPMLAAIHLAKGELDAARRLQQQTLYQSLANADFCMISLIGIARQEQREDLAQHICTLQAKLIADMGLSPISAASNHLTQAQLYCAQGKDEQALEELELFATSALDARELGNSFADSPLFGAVELMQPVVSAQYLQQNWVKMLEMAPGLESLKQTPRYRDVVGRLKDALKKDC